MCILTRLAVFQGSKCKWGKNPGLRISSPLEQEWMAPGLPAPERSAVLRTVKGTLLIEHQAEKTSVKHSGEARCRIVVKKK